MGSLPHSAACKTVSSCRDDSWRELRVGDARVGFAPGPAGEGLDLWGGVATSRDEVRELARASLAAGKLEI